MKRASLLLFGAILVVACDKKDSSAAPDPATGTKKVEPAASMTAATPPKAVEAPMAGQKRFMIGSGKATFLIDAPLEKIKGETGETKGSIDLDTSDITKSKGEVSFRLTTLKTNTFGDKGKDESQTEHAQNWMEVGKESAADKRSKFEWATFTLKSVTTDTPKLTDVKEDGGARTFKAKLVGSLTLHGISSDKTIAVKVSVKGPADAPTEISVSSEEPMSVSLKEHSIMPRDGVGSFLQGALEKIGKKIDDKVQVTLSATGK